MSMIALQKLIENTRVELFRLPQLNNHKNELFIQRDDLIHAEISGNKLRKLKYNIKAYLDNECSILVTFGGAFSNHLLATAAACNLLNIPVVGVVRGNELTKNSNQLLKHCFDLGMELIFEYRSAFSELKSRNGVGNWNEKKAWFVPEGGANNEGILGCEEILDATVSYDFICVAQGTSTTSLGLLKSIQNETKLIAVPVLKGYDSFSEMRNLNIKILSTKKQQLIVLNQYHFGGYAKRNQQLIDFIDSFNRINTFEIEPVYTGKAMFALHQFLINGQIENKKVLFVHTGGLNKWIN